MDVHDQPRGRDQLSEALRAEVVDFLRDWLPEQVKHTYRQMIADDPELWYRDPHFAGGVIVKGALRGNGIDERALGISSLDAIWPELLHEALAPIPNSSRGSAPTTDSTDPGP